MCACVVCVRADWGIAFSDSSILFLNEAELHLHLSERYLYTQGSTSLTDATLILKQSDLFSFIRIPCHPEENCWLPIYSICHAYIQYVCSIIRFPRLSGYICRKRMCAVKRGLTIVMVPHWHRLVKYYAIPC